MSDTPKVKGPGQPAGRIEAFCPYEDCKTKFLLDATLAGQRVRCGKCSRRFLVSSTPGQPSQKLEENGQETPKESRTALRPKEASESPEQAAPQPQIPRRKTVLVQSLEQLELAEQMAVPSQPPDVAITDEPSSPLEENQPPEESMSVDIAHLPSQTEDQNVLVDDSEKAAKEAEKMSLLEPEPPPPPPKSVTQIQAAASAKADTEAWVTIMFVAGILLAGLLVLVLFLKWDKWFGSGEKPVLPGANSSSAPE